MITEKRLAAGDYMGMPLAIGEARYTATASISPMTDESEEVGRSVWTHHENLKIAPGRQGILGCQRVLFGGTSVVLLQPSSQEIPAGSEQKCVGCACQ
jgi:hypothetical protein